MKLILTQVVTNLGGPGDIVEVRDGYGRNFLVPQGMGVRWTKGGQKQVDQLKAAVDARGARDEAHVADLKAKFEAAAVTVQVQAGSEGRLFGSVTPAQIADALTELAGESIDKRTIVIDVPIKATGTHTVGVKLADDETVKVELNVTSA